MTFSKSLWICTLALSMPEAALALDGDAGFVSSVQGDVKVDSRPTAVGSKLKAGSTIETGNGKATLLVGGGSVMHLGEDSSLQIKAYTVIAKKENVDVELHQGKLRGLFRT